jgi:transglutaminase-like putative cysteine protease
VLVHPSFDGRRWQRQPSDFRALPSGPLGQTADQLWLVEPSRFTAVPWDGRSLPLDGRLRLDPLGELQLDQPPANARAYPMDTVAAAPDWQRAPPRPADLRLPAGGEPRLRALAEGWRRLAEPQQRVAAAQSWFLNAGFRYDTQPGPLPERDGLDAFLFTTRVGFCGHYASAFTALMRAAGVPARVVTGYFGGDWVVPLGGSPYLELRQSDAHAWSEVWLPESGWNRIDPSSWATGSPETTVRAAEGSPARAGRLNPWQWLQRQWWGLDVAWSRWWLGFDRAGQEALLQRLFGANRHWLGWTILAALVIGLLAGLALVGRWGRQPRQDWLERDLKRLLSLLSRLAIPARPGESLQSLCDRAGQRHPSLAPLLADLAERHALLRFAAPPSDGNEARRARQAWKLALRQLKRSCQDAIRQQTSSTP